MEKSKGEKFKIKEVLQARVSREELSVRAFTDKYNLPYETFKNLYYGDSKDPSASTVILFAEALGITPYELLGYAAADEEKLLENYRTCGTYGKHLVSMVAKKHALAAEDEENAEKHKITIYVQSHLLVDGMETLSCVTKEIVTSNKRAIAGYQLETDFFSDHQMFKGDIVLVEPGIPGCGNYGVFSDGKISYFRIFDKSDKPEYKYLLRPVGKFAKPIYFNDLDNEYICMGKFCGIYDEKEKV